ncbi:MAG: insulinase family protein, partial [Planctomycetes bacterium]|nr:insulinase family protein [Planctomycetota bacterium]
DVLGEPDGLQRDLARYLEASVEGVNEAAQRHLAPENRLLLTVRPKRPALARPVDRETRPPIAGPRVVIPSQPERRRLASGHELVHFPRPGAPLSQVLVCANHGASSDPEGQEGRAWLLAGMLDEGTKDLGASAFTEALERLGARAHCSANHHQIQVGLAALPHRLHDALELVLEAAFRPPFNPAEWDRVKRIHLESLESESDDPARVAGRAGARAFFGPKHPYGRSILGDIGAIRSMSRDDVAAIHAAVMVSPGLRFYVASEHGTDALARQLDELLAGRLPPAASGLDEAEAWALDDAERKLCIVHRPDAVQTLIRHYMPSVPDGSKDRVPLLLLDTIFGGSFTSRLNQNLREEHGYTYGVRTGFQMQKTCGWHITSTSVQTEVTGDALRETFTEFKKLRLEGVTEHEVEKARQQRRTELVESLETSGALLSTVCSLDRLGHDFAELEREMREVAACTKDRLDALAETAYPTERGTLLLVGDREKILPQLEGLSLPAPEELDPQGRPII